MRSEHISPSHTMSRTLSDVPQRQSGDCAHVSTKPGRRKHFAGIQKAKQVGTEAETRVGAGQFSKGIIASLFIGRSPNVGRYSLFIIVRIKRIDLLIGHFPAQKPSNTRGYIRLQKIGNMQNPQRMTLKIVR